MWPSRCCWIKPPIIAAHWPPWLGVVGARVQRHLEGGRFHIPELDRPGPTRHEAASHVLRSALLTLFEVVERLQPLALWHHGVARWHGGVRHVALALLCLFAPVVLPLNQAKSQQKEHSG